ncbi:MAG: RNA methyltransferase [Flavobacteriales bacterium]|nr:MAG: RNA methyltransferase [Flavobacteriales bacterium]
MKLLVKTLFGLEEVLAREIEELGGKEIQPIKRGVSFIGSKELLYKSNLHLRTALRVLQPIHIFKAKNEKQLYDKVKAIDWSWYFDSSQTFAIDSIVFAEHFTHSNFPSLKMKDAIADQFREKEGKRPSIDKVNPDIRLNLHVSHETCTISLDSSGDSLHKRGYRRGGTHAAPLNEVLAAGLVLLSGWDKQSPFIDPMCGSGTIAMEAAMIARNMPAGIKRKEYAFMKWKNYDPELWQRIYDEGVNEMRPVAPKLITAADQSNTAVELCKMASLDFELDREIEVFRKGFKRLLPISSSGTLIMNPPYGQRLHENELFALYSMIGDQLKQQYTGFDAWIFSGNPEALKHVGLKTSKRVHLLNGALECKFHHYSMYKGSKKQSRE